MDWLEYFRKNRAERMAIPWELEIVLPQDLRLLLISSLRHFQLGEQGEGIHLRKCARATGDRDYADAIDLFVEEENEHAMLMAQAIGKMGGKLMTSHWSDHCFVFIRRVLGLRLELMVLMTAEMIATRYFGALNDALDDPLLRAMLKQINHDERGHLAFHVEYLRRFFEPTSLRGRRLARLAWRFLFRGACLVVLVNHGRLLGALGVPPRRFLRDCDRIFLDQTSRIFVDGAQVTAGGVELAKGR